MKHLSPGTVAFLAFAIFTGPKPAQCGPADQAPDRELPPLVLAQGEQWVLRFDGILKFSVGSPSVHVLAAPGGKGDRLLIKGVRPGISDLWVWIHGGRIEHRTIHVLASDEAGFKPALFKALGKLEEAEVAIAGEGAIIRGEVHSIAESARVAALMHAFPNEIRNETRLTTELLEWGQTLIKNWLRESGNEARIRVEARDGALWVGGSASDPQNKAALESKILGLFPLAGVEIESLPDGAPTVHFRVYLLELRKSRFRSFGLTWPASQEAAFRVSSGAIQDLLQLDVTLEALEGEGSAKILAKPELVVRAPGEAELFSGGELPIHLQSHFYSNVDWKSYGLSLKLKVTSTTFEKVRLDISAEVSRLDPTISEDKIPGLQTNRMKTQVDASYGRPLLLSGLLQDSTRNQAKGLPLLRQIPILGALFGSEDYLTEKSELVAVLLPTLTPPDAPMERLARLTPKGTAPPPRNWISPQAQRDLKVSPDYPWNALQ